MADIPKTADDSWDKHIDRVLGELLRLYRTTVEPMERSFAYDQFKPSWFSEAIVQKKPFITFLGPFSAGKSTFINYLMQSNYLVTGPQPVTDKFTVIMHGDEIQQIPGRVLVADSSQPFRGLQQFGDTFLECFQGVVAPHPILRSVSLIDTPGVLEAAGEGHQRRYDYIKACRWFVEKSDLVFFLFDPTKLDAGPELRMLFKHALKGFESKIRIVLNKADSVGPQELMRVYGALFWNLSNLINTTEPPRVYVSSFWDQPYKPDTNHELFTDEKSDLLYDLTEVVPMQSLDKRVTSVLKRAQDVRNHCLVVALFRSKMPRFFGKDKAKKELYNQLPQLMEELSTKYKISMHDFCPPDEYVAFLDKLDLETIPDMEKMERKGWLNAIRKLIDQDLPLLLKPIKSTEVIDPRDRKHAIMLQRDYNQSLQDQLAGKGGAQGALGEMATPIFRASTLPNAASYYPAMQQQQQQQVQPQMMQQPQPQPQMDMQQMMLMMQMMQQQQQPQQFQQQPSMQFPPQQQYPVQQQSGVFVQQPSMQLPPQQQYPVQQQSGVFQPSPSASAYPAVYAPQQQPQLSQEQMMLMMQQMQQQQQRQ
jgi:hypothetical protein